MTFGSLVFVLVFLPLVVVANRFAVRVGWGRQLLLVASILLYAFASPTTLPALVASFLVNWFVVRRMHAAGDSPWRRRWLLIGLFSNVGFLAVVKYTAFVLETVRPFTHHTLQLPSFVLPLGISFFTIQQVMYVVDVYEKLGEPAPFLDHALFISFFPVITAGPLVRGRAFFPQLDEKQVTDEQLASGLALFATGLGRKVVVAGLASEFADWAFGPQDRLSMPLAWVGAAAFTVQLYFDFSGYSDMAVGSALMLGLKIPENFDRPFTSKTVIEFWKRWHITLSNFITTYLFTPIAKSMKPLTFPKAMGATLVSMLIAGLWHGAAWTFVIFGFLHGAALVTNNVWRKTKKKVPPLLAQALTVAFVVCTFVVFRSSGLAQAGTYLGWMVGVGHGRSPAWPVVPTPMLLLSILCAIPLTVSRPRMKEFVPSMGWAAACAGTIVVSCLLLNSGGVKDFIYRGF